MIVVVLIEKMMIMIACNVAAAVVFYTTQEKGSLVCAGAIYTDSHPFHFFYKNITPKRTTISTQAILCRFLFYIVL